MNAREARERTEIILAAIDNQKYFDILKKDIDFAIGLNADTGSWECRFPLARYIVNSDVIEMLLDHYRAEGFEVEFQKEEQKPKGNLYEFNTTSIVLSWRRKLHEVTSRENPEPEPPTTPTPTSPSPPPHTGGTPMAASAERGGEDGMVDLEGIFVEPAAAVAAA